MVVDGIVDIPLAGQPLGLEMGPAPGIPSALSEFVAGPENCLVQVAVRSLLGNPAQSAPSTDRHNPLVLFGRSGTGKSHLARGLLAAWKARYPAQRVVYTTAVDFARELSDAIVTQAVDELHARYRNASLLVIEDIGWLAAKRPDRDNERRLAQEELLYCFDHLLASRARLVITASAAPSELTGLSLALQSRLMGGLCIPLAPPGPAARLTILQRLAKLHHFDLPDPVASLLADGLHVTVPELDGALVQLHVHAQLEHRSIDLQSARHFLNQRTGQQQPQLHQIAAAVARLFSVPLAQLRGPSRCRAAVTARDVAMYLARHLAEKSLQQIGRYFGGRDHTTVMHGLRQTEKLLKTDPSIRQAVEQLQQRWRKPEQNKC